MLSRKMKLKFDGLEVGSTPMLLPSLSSRINIDIPATLQMVSEIITGPVLISAYDVHYIDSFPEITFPDLIFLDSGGYECSKEQEVSDIGLYKPDSCNWNRDMHLKTIQKWKSDIPTVVISYDHPSEREDIGKQIAHAESLFESRNDIIKEFLIKPETVGATKINLDSLLQKIDSLNQFDIIGVTEKELGKSVLERMTTIANMRLKMEDEGVQIPIHVFGSLDTITTPLYYFSGADIFDGLSWLRFAFNEGNTLYIHSCGSKEIGIHVNVNNIWALYVSKNYNYLRLLELDLKKFSSSENDFGVFKHNSEFFTNSCEYLNVEIGGVM